MTDKTTSSFWKHVARNVVNRDKRHQPPQRPPLRPFTRPVPEQPAEGGCLADDHDPANPDIITWRLMAPGSSSVH